MIAAVVHRVWFGRGVWATVGRLSLWPLAGLYGGGIGVRNAMYERRLFRVHPGTIPAISVGNLTVGGTGKTPVAAWIAHELVRRGVRPAIVLRGYGADEPAVHTQLNPGMTVVVDPDRVAGVRRAASVGAGVAVLDDAFQHRRVARAADVVVVAAERGLAHARLLPAGPFREPVSALRRASLVVVTRKTATAHEAAAVLDAATAVSGGPGTVVSLQPEALRSLAGPESRPISDLRGHEVTLVTGVGEPEFLAAQLRAQGAGVTLRAYPDHHAFTGAELAAEARAAGPSRYAVCTLKDAVKISSRWPGPVPLWYVSQRVTAEQGVDQLQNLLDRIISAVPPNPPTAG
jgi:tetraacyldisaccharide 4'-kinase